MEINGTIYGFTILPRGGEVIASIYRELHNASDPSSPIHIHMIDKRFGGVFRGPNEKDYIAARIWIEMHFKAMLENNKHI